MKTNPNDYAHPEVFTDLKMDQYNRQYGDTYSVGGLTKLEHFAGLAMQGIIASGVNHESKYDVCKVAVEMAKALITELNNQHEK